MHVTVAVRWLPKAGRSSQEYEDAFAPESLDAEAWYWRGAVADGATETSYSREWAQELVRGFCSGRIGRHRMTSGLPRAQGRWRARLDARPMPWYAEEKLRMGAFATLVGLSLHIDGSWACTAAGDSCMFQVRGKRLRKAFPLTRSDQFSSRPALLSSLPSQAADSHRLTRTTSSGWATGDRFLLMTDALALWLLERAERRESAVETLTYAARSANTFESWVMHQRHNGRLKNDDVTLMSVEVRA